MKTLLFLLLVCSLSLTLPTLSDATSAYPSVPGTAPADCSFSDGHEAHDTAPLIPPRREVYGNGRIFDITHLITTATSSYGSPDGVLGQFLWFPHRKKNGSIASVFKLPSHTGTHIDSPGHYFHHYLDAGFDVDTLDLEVLNGN